jgi:hypothetical protein
MSAIVYILVTAGYRVPPSNRRPSSICMPVSPKRPAKNKPIPAKPPKIERTVVTAQSARATPGTVERAEALLDRARAASSANAQRARALIAEIRTLLERITESAHRIGVLLDDLRDPALYHSLGYDSFEALLRGEDLMSRAQAQKLITVAATYTPAMLRQLGVSKAYALVAYVERTPDSDIAAALARDDAPINGKPISQATVRDIRLAAKEIALRTRAPSRTGGRPRTTDPVAEAKKKLAAIERALRARGIQDLELDLRLTRGRYYLNLRLPLEEAEHLLE